MSRFEGIGASEIKSTGALSIMSILKSIGVSYGFTLLVFIVFAFLITYTNCPETAIGTVVIATTVLSVMLAGMVISKKARTKGWLNGAIGGLIYIVILYILGVTFVTGFVFNSHVMLLLAIGFLAGAIGGIIGINIKKDKK